MLAKLFSNSHTLVFGEVLLNSLTLLTILSFGLLLLGLLGLLLFSRISLNSFLFKNDAHLAILITGRRR